MAWGPEFSHKNVTRDSKVAPAYNPRAEKTRTGRPQGLAGGQPSIISKPQTVREPVSENKADSS